MSIVLDVIPETSWRRVLSARQLTADEADLVTRMCGDPSRFVALSCRCGWSTLRVRGAGPVEHSCAETRGLCLTSAAHRLASEPVPEGRPVVSYTLRTVRGAERYCTVAGCPVHDAGEAARPEPQPEPEPPAAPMKPEVAAPARLPRRGQAHSPAQFDMWGRR